MIDHQDVPLIAGAAFYGVQAVLLWPIAAVITHLLLDLINHWRRESRKVFS